MLGNRPFTVVFRMTGGAGRCRRKALFGKQRLMGVFGAPASIVGSLFVVGCTGDQLAARNLNIEIRPVSTEILHIAAHGHGVSV